MLMEEVCVVDAARVGREIYVSARAGRHLGVVGASHSTGQPLDQVPAVGVCVS